MWRTEGLTFGWGEEEKAKAKEKEKKAKAKAKAKKERWWSRWVGILGGVCVWMWMVGGR